MEKRKDDRGVSLLSSSSPRNTLLAHMYQSLTNHSLFVSHFFSLGMKNGGARKKRFACMQVMQNCQVHRQLFFTLYVKNMVSFFAVCFEDIFWQQCTAYFFLYLKCTLIYIDHISTTAMYRHIYITRLMEVTLDVCVTSSPLGVHRTTTSDKSVY